VGCKGCGAVTGGVNSDGSDGNTVAAGPNTGDKCSFCALGYYGSITGLSTNFVGCDKACPEESTTYASQQVKPTTGAGADDVSVCDVCQVGYFVRVPADAAAPAAAVCAQCPGNSTTSLPVSSVVSATTAAEACLYCKTGSVHHPSQSTPSQLHAFAHLVVSP